MEVKNSFGNFIQTLSKKAKSIIFGKSAFSEKQEVNFEHLKIVSFIMFLLFISIVLLLPDESTVEFTEALETHEKEVVNESLDKPDNPRNQLNTSETLWGSPKVNYQRNNSSSASTDYNKTTLLGFKNGNSKTQLRAGEKLPLRIVDKFIVSDSPVPILAELILNVTTDSGLSLPAGTRFYGEASFQRGANRARIQFTQVSLPNGEIKSISGFAIGKDGQPGLPGRVYSDGMRNTAGQVITTFVGGLASGSMETDILGRSKGGLQNGLLSAVAVASKERAQAYGEKMKAEREWIEVTHGFECDAILNESMNLQNGGDNNE